MELLTSEQLKQEQQKTRASTRMRYGFLARLLFVSMDLLYGRKKTLSKFKVLEIIARVPYQAWENVAYVAMTHIHADPVLHVASSTVSRKAGFSRTTSSGI